MALSLDSLFTPAASGVTPGNAGATASSGSWLSTLLSVASTLGLSATSWQPGGVARTILAIVATADAARDQVIVKMIKGGFLDSAATVTPDPSNANTWTSATWTPGWLDVLADGVYNVQRIAATYATGTINVVASSSAAGGTFQPGTYHVANGSGKTFSNTQAFTVTPSSTTPITIAADIAGSSSNSATGGITTTVTSLVGVTVTNPQSINGSDAESNAALVTRCRQKLQALSPNGPKGAYAYFALAASQLRAAATGNPSAITSPITRALVTVAPTTGIVTLYVASANGTVSGVAGLAVTAATNASPIAITTASAHGLSTGAVVTVSGVLGNSAANGTWIVAVVDATHFTLNGSNGVGFGTYATSGVIQGGDLGQVDYVIQSQCVPNAVTALTVSAAAALITFTIDVWVPAAQVQTAGGLVQSQIATYVAGLPIGGVTDPSGAYTNALLFDSVLGAIYQTSGLNVQQATLLLNGQTTNIALSPNQVAVISGLPTVNVHGI